MGLLAKGDLFGQERLLPPWWAHAFAVLALYSMDECIVCMNVACSMYKLRDVKPQEIVKIKTRGVTK